MDPSQNGAAVIVNLDRPAANISTVNLSISQNCPQCRVETQNEKCEHCQRQNKIILLYRILMPISSVVGFASCVFLVDPLTSIGVGLTVVVIVGSIINIFDW